LYLYCIFKCQFLLAVLPSPKVVDAPENVSANIGSTVKFNCGFQTTTNTSIAQIHWLYNGEDIEQYKIGHDLSANITNSSYKDSYILSTLAIYSVQADNAGEYSCYCSYDKTKLDIEHPGTIQSDVKFANLNVSDKQDKKMIFYIIVGAAVVLGVVIFLLVIGIIVIRIRKKNCRIYGYKELVSSDSFSG